MHDEPIRGGITLKRGKEKPVRQQHPWIFSGAIQSVEGAPAPGDLVTVFASDKTPLALGYWNPSSQIRVRLLTWADPGMRELPARFWRSRFQTAILGRAALDLDTITNSYRLIYSESDGVPGLVVDRYGAYLVMQCATLGIDRRKTELAHVLLDMELPDGTRPKGILERSDIDVRKKEGLEPIIQPLAGDPPPKTVSIEEYGVRLSADLYSGHKTGAYLDQRDNRRLLADPVLSQGKTVLNLFAYTGGFAVHAAIGHAQQILNVDVSIPMLELAEANVLANCPDRTQDEYWAGDAFQVLRDYRDEGRQFDTIILDPPKFAKGVKDLNRASRGYKDINLLALQLLKPGGSLLTFSCSGSISADLFQKIVFGASVDAEREVQILRYLTQAPDHPVRITFPESFYLKGLHCRVW